MKTCTRDIGSRYEEPDFRDPDIAKCCGCGELGDIETMHTKDSCDWRCGDCYAGVQDSKRAEQKDEGVNYGGD